MVMMMMMMMIMMMMVNNSNTDDKINDGYEQYGNDNYNKEHKEGNGHNYEVDKNNPREDEKQ